jgi:hypothetical protein
MIDIEAPGFSVSATISRFCASDQRRRRCRDERWNEVSTKSELDTSVSSFAIH